MGVLGLSHVCLRVIIQVSKGHHTSILGSSCDCLRVMQVSKGHHILYKYLRVIM